MKQFKQWETTEEEKTFLKRCCKALKKVNSDIQIILYGSRARGEAYDDSDYDLLILVDGNVNLEEENRFRIQLYPLELETGKVLTVNAYSHQEWNTSLYSAMPFYQNIKRDGVILWSKKQKI